MAEKKDIPFALLEILKEFTDKEHTLSSGEILYMLRTIYDLEAERRTIYANILLLRKYGYDIDDWNTTHTGYRLNKHQFAPDEVTQLCKLIRNSKELSNKQKADLCDRLTETLSKCEPPLLNLTVIEGASKLQTKF